MKQRSNGLCHEGIQKNEAKKQAQQDEEDNFLRVSLRQFVMQMS
jgi:hypothetical protein